MSCDKFTVDGGPLFAGQSRAALGYYG